MKITRFEITPEELHDPIEPDDHSKIIIKKRKTPLPDPSLISPNIPDYVLHAACSELTKSELKIFLYLSRHAITNKRSANYSYCWKTYKEIAKGTGVAEGGFMRHHLKEIEKKGFIIFSYQRHPPTGRGFTTSHRFEIRWMNQIRLTPHNIIKY